MKITKTESIEVCRFKPTSLRKIQKNSEVHSEFRDLIEKMQGEQTIMCSLNT